MKVTGKIRTIEDVQKGTSKDGKDWQKLIFTLVTNEQYNNLYAIEIFGEEKVNKFLKYNNVGTEIDVDFNIKTNEWQGKYFTSLQYWKSFKAETQKVETTEENDDLPF